MQQYSGIISVILLFVDGLLFGVAVKKGIISAVLLVIAILLASYVGLSVPYLSTVDILRHVENIALSMYNHLGPIFVGYPIVFIVGLAIGIWKG